MLILLSSHSLTRRFLHVHSYANTTFAEQLRMYNTVQRTSLRRQCGRRRGHVFGASVVDGLLEKRSITVAQEVIRSTTSGSHETPRRSRHRNFVNNAAQVPTMPGFLEGNGWFSSIQNSVLLLFEYGRGNFTSSGKYSDTTSLHSSLYFRRIIIYGLMNYVYGLYRLSFTNIVKSYIYVNIMV